MDPSQIRRVVLLVDLQPLLDLRDLAGAYSTSVLAAARRILSFPALSSTLFACKPFFSSLSPLLSTSAVQRLLGKSAAFLSFDLPSHTLDSLARTLTSLSLSAASDEGFAERFRPSCASLMAESLSQLAYDCTWEPVVEVAAGTGEIFTVRPNLVVMFSYVRRSAKCFSEFLDLDADKEICGADELCAKLFRTFSIVNDLFIARNVHFSWIDVNPEPLHLCGDSLHTQIIDKGIKSLGWSFCTTDAIVLGSVLIPLGLILPYVGGYQLTHCSIDKLIKGRAELSLKISDKNSMPLECKLCDVEMFVLRFHRENVDTDIFQDNSGGDITKIQVRKVLNISKQPKVEGKICASLLLRGLSQEPKGGQTIENSDGSFRGKTEGQLPDQVLEMFSTEKGEVFAGKPVWQLLLAFLYKRNLCASVSVCSSSGNSFLGILRPFTIHSAIMHLMDSSWIDDANEIPKLDSCWNICGSAIPKDITCGKKRIKKHLIKMQNLTWKSFNEYVFRETVGAYLEVDIEELYFANGCNGSKKLRFLQCWMKQIKKCSYPIASVIEMEEKLVTTEEMEERSVSSQQEISLPSIEEAHPFQPVNEESPTIAFLEDSETFAQNVLQKINYVLNSKEADLGSSAERLVNLAIHFFSSKYGMNREEETLSEEETSRDAMVAAEIVKLFLRKPKDVASKYKSSNASSLSSNSSIHSELNKVREHELQILCRMEILESRVGSSIEDNLRLKMVKDICLLLGNIEFNLQGGMFDGESLVEFAGRTIKSRYEHSLVDIVQQIYSQMEFFSFDGHDGEGSSLPNSNSEPQMAEEGSAIHRAALGDTFVKKCDSAHSMEYSENNVLVTAQERRERARRFSHFTSWRQNLQRVWALKQAKTDRQVLNSFHRSSHKKRLHVSRKDMVCETPMMHPKDSAIQQDDGREERKIRRGNASLSKALFHSESDS